MGGVDMEVGVHWLSDLTRMNKSIGKAETPWFGRDLRGDFQPAALKILFKFNILRNSVKIY